MTTAGRGQVDLLEELVDDREVTDFEQDALGHAHLVDEIASLVRSVQTPATVALFGAWGSGKSGIANLLRQRLAELRPCGSATPAFAVFDAFKFRNLPMRRHFLIEIGRQLLPEDEAEARREALYSSTSGEDVSLPPLKQLGKPIAWFLTITGGFAVLAVVAAFVVSWFGGNFSSTLGTILASVLAPAALFSGLLAIAGRTITVRRTIEVPSSEEQFEQEFKDLVSSLQGRRLVVFVDELDRCAPDTVVEALDTIRTFLGIKDTVFVVAADQQVLENALTLRVRQATPADSLNPYYSSGTAYLDKVFNYQLSIPPLLPSRVTQFVVDMLQAKGGIWEGLDLPRVASVLIPSHVRSPRRVKMLLNNFVLAYRSLEGRAVSGHISSALDGREAEIAKLVCLQTEFPLFARELTLSERLPELVTTLIDNPQAGRPSDVSEVVWSRAEDFAPKGGAIVATMLHEQPDETSDSAPTPDSEDAQRLTNATPVEAHRKQLHNYLQKTRNVRGPGRDLIFQESRGALFGLEESFAADIEDAAVNGRVSEVRNSVEGASDEPTIERTLRFLAHLVQTALPGVEGENSASSLLAAAVVAPGSAVEVVADQAIRAVLSHRTRSQLQRDDYPGVLLLALKANDPRAGELIDGILAADDAVNDPEVGMTILKSLEEMPTSVSEDKLAAVAGPRLLDTDTAEEATRLLVGHLEVLRSSLPYLAGQIKERNAANGDVEEFEAMSACLAAASDEGALDVLEILLELPFSVPEDVDWRGLASERLADLGMVTSPRLARRILSAVAVAPPDEAIGWLSVIPVEVVADSDSQALVQEALAALWSRRGELGGDYTNHDAEFVALLRELVRLANDLPSRDLTEVAVRDLPDMVQGQEAAAGSDWGHARCFADEGLIVPERLATDLVERLERYLETGVVGGAAQGVVMNWAHWLVDHRDGSSGPSKLIDLVAGSSLFASPRSEEVTISLERASDTGTRYSVSHMQDLISSHGDGALNAVATWLQVSPEAPQALWEMVSPYLRLGIYPEGLSEAVRACAQSLGGTQTLDLFRSELAEISARDPNVAFLGDILSAELDDKAVAAELVAAYEQYGTNDKQRERVFIAWGVATPRQASAIRMLVEKVLVPTLQATKGGLAIAKRHPETWWSPEGVKNLVRDALRVAAGGKDQDKALEKLMRANGVVAVKKSFLGRREREVDELG